MNTRLLQSGFQPIGRDRLLLLPALDDYRISGKLPEPTVCMECAAVYYDGEWQWLPSPSHAHQVHCPACNRIRDHYPAGYVTLSGEFFTSNEQQILHRVQNQAAHEKPWHPLQRIMSIEKLGNDTLITTTDLHLARGIGESLHLAYQGELEYHYNPEEKLLRVIWSR